MKINSATSTKSAANGLIDIEIFSANDWWKRDPDEVLRICVERHQTVV